MPRLLSYGLWIGASHIAEPTVPRVPISSELLSYAAAHFILTLLLEELDPRDLKPAELAPPNYIDPIEHI